MDGSKSKIHVLWLVDHLGYNGVMHGAGMYYLNSIPVFDRRTFKIVLCVLRKEDHLTRLFTEKGVEIRHLGRSKFDPLTLTDILGLCKKERIQLIHAHGYGAANFGRFARMIRGTTTIVHAHDDDRNYPFHQKFADKMLRHYTDKAIAVSESVKASSVSKRNIPEEKVHVLHNGIPLENFTSPGNERVEKERVRLGVPLDVKVIGTVAKLREEKGTRYLINSAVNVLKMFPKTVFLIVGDGPLKNDLISLSRKLGIEQQVIFAGFCTDIPAILSIIDIVAIPSLTEGSPLALLEAMAMGKPIVASAVGGNKEIMKDGETGYLVPSQDPDELCNKLIYLLKNWEKAEYIGLKAKEKSRMYDVNRYVRRLEEYYKELLS